MGKNFNPYLDRVVRPFWETNGEALRVFNKGLVKDPRIDVTILPLFDGVTQIKWRRDLQRGVSMGTLDDISKVKSSEPTKHTSGNSPVETGGVKSQA